MRKLFLILASLVSLTACEQKTWVQIGSTSEYKVYFNPSSRYFDVNTETAKIWIQFEYESTQKHYFVDKYYKSSKAFLSANCHTQNLTLLETKYYNVNGDNIESSKISSDWGRSVPGTIGGEIYKAACTEPSWWEKFSYYF